MFALFLVYVVVEVAALIWVGSTIGVLWTILLLLAGSLLGMTLVRSQGRRVLTEFGRANRGEIEPGGPVADGMLVGIGAILLFVPGLVTTLIGLLLLIPLTRRVLRPAVAFFMARLLAKSVARGAGPMGRGPTVIDGEIVGDTTPAPAAGLQPVDLRKVSNQTIDGTFYVVDHRTGEGPRHG